MPWTVELSKKATSQFLKLDNGTKNRIKDFIIKLAALDNPRHNGKYMQGEYSAYYRYKVGHYRLICHIEDSKMLITVIKMGHRQDVYK